MQMTSLLIVDDDHDGITLIRAALDATGIDTPVSEAHDEPTALLRLHDLTTTQEMRACPVTLIDLDSPSIDWQGLVRSIRLDTVISGTPVLAISKRSEASTVLDAYRSGCNAYYNKPESFTELVALLMESLSHWNDTALLPPSIRGGGGSEYGQDPPESMRV